jgi:hypothetical protein
VGEPLETIGVGFTEGLKLAQVIPQGLARLGKGQTANTRGPLIFVAFAFDVHDATIHRLDTTKACRFQPEKRLRAASPGKRNR